MILAVPKSADRLPVELVMTYEALVALTKAHGFVPSYEELAQKLGIGKSTVMSYLFRLEANGNVTRTPGKSRSWVAVRKPRRNR